MPPENIYGGFRMMFDAIAAYCEEKGYSLDYAHYWYNHQKCAVQGCKLPVWAPHHIRTRGAHGVCDEAWNLFEFCKKHHGEIHVGGVLTFAEKHPETKEKILAALDRAPVSFQGSKTLRGRVSGPTA